MTNVPRRKLPEIPLVHEASGGGEGGIRTHGTLARTTVFETVPIDHSGTSPRGPLIGWLNRRRNSSDDGSAAKRRPGAGAQKFAKKLTVFKEHLTSL
jgi:hypothetical protein